MTYDNDVINDLSDDLLIYHDPEDYISTTLNYFDMWLSYYKKNDITIIKFKCKQWDEDTPCGCGYRYQLYFILETKDKGSHYVGLYGVNKYINKIADTRHNYQIKEVDDALEYGFGGSYIEKVYHPIMRKYKAKHRDRELFYPPPFQSNLFSEYPHTSNSQPREIKRAILENKCGLFIHKLDV